MATITTDTYFDSLTRTSSEIYTINTGATLTINTDVRYSAGALAGGDCTLNDVDCDATTPGTLFIDGRDVRWLAYSGGASTVPGYNVTLDGTSGATGIFMNVTSGLQYAPVASGASMPSTGYIKFKSVSAHFMAGDVIKFSGTTLGTATSEDVTGWLEIPKQDATECNLAGNGTLSISGEWFYLDNTDGTTGQIIQAPTYGGSNTYYPGLWIEDSVGAGTYTCWPAIYAGGTSPWKDPANSGIATDVRGKYVESMSWARFRIGSDGSNNVGYVPVSGLRTRIPNILLVSTSAGAASSNAVPNTTSIDSRPDFRNNSPGAVYVDKAMSTWFFYLNRYRACSLKHLAVFDEIYFLYIGSPFYVEDTHIGSYAKFDRAAFRITSCTLGGQILNSHVTRATTAPAAGDYGLQIAESSFITVSGCTFAILAPRAATTAYPLIIGGSDSTVINNTVIGGSFRFSGNRMAAINTIYCDNIWGNTITTNAVNGAIYAYALNNSTIDGMILLSGVTNIHPYGAFVYTESVSDIIIKNFGTRGDPLNHGSVNPAAYSFATNTSTASSNVKLQRAYTQNATSKFYTGSTTSDNVEIVNCGGGYSLTTSDVTTVPTNVKFKNLACANWTTANVLAAGSIFHNIFVNTVSGRLGVAMNEPSSASADYCILTPHSSSGMTGWTRAGVLNMRQAGDFIEWTWPYPVLGVNGFQASDGVLTGTNTSNHTFYYAIKYPSDSAYSTWKTATSANLTAETPDASLGFNIKFLISGNTSSSTNALTSAYLLTYASGTAQDVLYPLEENFVTIDTNGLLANTRIQLYNMTTSGEMVNEIVTSGEYSVTFDTEWYDSIASDQDVIRLRAAKLGYLPFESLGVFSEDTGLSFIVAQEEDTVYTTNGVDGSTVTEYSLDIPNVEIDMDDPDGETTVQRGYAWFSYILTTESGIRSAFGGFDAIDEVNYRANSDVLDFQFDNINADPLHITGGYVFRSDGGQIIASGSGPLFLDAGKAYLATSAGASVASGVWAQTIEGGLNAAQVQRILLAVAAGISDVTDLGGGNATVKFYGQDDVTARVTADMTGSERTDVTLDGD